MANSYSIWVKYYWVATVSHHTKCGFQKKASGLPLTVQSSWRKTDKSVWGWTGPGSTRSQLKDLQASDLTSLCSVLSNRELLALPRTSRWLAHRGASVTARCLLPALELLHGQRMYLHRVQISEWVETFNPEPIVFKNAKGSLDQKLWEALA